MFSKLFSFYNRCSKNDYVSIARIDHWFKNIFILPGIILVPFFFQPTFDLSLCLDIVLAIIATCVVASSNYVINEILDAEKDKHHPVKKDRPVASGKVIISIAYIEWIILGIFGIVLGFLVNSYVGFACLSLWVMGCIYNIPPIRSKEVPYLDVLSESVNNPIRMIIGWYATGVTAMPPISILFAYWMLGAFLMATKRLAEYRKIDNPEVAANYRSSFKFYNEERLIAGNIFYVALFMMGIMAFIMLYKIELVFTIPALAYVFAFYAYVGFQEDSPVQYPERLYKNKHLMRALFFCCMWCFLILYIFEFPWFENIFILLTPQR